MMRIPLSTYRIQFDPNFGFRTLRDIVPFLAALGISDVYASPIFQAKEGSSHGYDVVDHNQLNPELGGEDEFEKLKDEVKKFGMGWIQDVIPNHMAFDGQNRMLMDVLENGNLSNYFDFFDVEWNHPYESMREKLLAPFLGKFYGECLEDGEIVLKYDPSGLSIQYYDLSFPLRVDSYPTVLSRALDILENSVGADNTDYVKFLGVISVLKTVPPVMEERREQIRFAKEILWELYSGKEAIKDAVDACIALFNGERGNPESFNLLDNLLSEQYFRLAFWKVAAEEINYRRFFNINGLISLRVEEDRVFDHIHAFIFRLLREGTVTGLRVDHIDGLNDPTAYLARVREEAADVYLVIEKILGREERLPPFWPVQGTTGYDFLNRANGIFCRKDNEREITRVYERFVEHASSYEDLLYEKKKLIIEKNLESDVDNLAHLLKKISGRYRYGSDITLYGLKRAIEEVLACFPVYRTYVSSEIFGSGDRDHIEAAVGEAAERNPTYLNELQFLEKILLLELEELIPEEEQQQCLHFILRFQQYTGPLMAKGLEDTTLYVYNRLLSLNEVGGEPGVFGIAVEDYHRFAEMQARQWPHSMNATSTHDTKRGEDVRARINVLSEIPREWEGAVRKWRRMNRRKKRSVGHRRIPDLNDEYFLYQTLVGAFPFREEEHPAFRERLKEYIIKAVREAKVHTAWIKPDEEYEEGFLSFIDKILSPGRRNKFPAKFLEFQRKVAYYGIFNSLSQTLIKITSPGVPDFYQGSELWDLSLVDPDNRRSVDFDTRASYLEDIRAREGEDLPKLIADLTRSMEDGRVKLFLIHRALKARRERKGLFGEGDYTKMETAGEFQDYLVAFARSRGDIRALTIVPRFLTGLIGEKDLPFGQSVWRDTSLLLPDGYSGSFTDAFTGQEIRAKRTLPVGDVLSHFPVSLLVGGGER
jgi:(1->4)-alpha-D-glucan 1-alpha-D-glucosylmutase